MKELHTLAAIPDNELLQRLTQLLRDSRHTEADLVGHIGEVDVRRLYAREASPSMFSYCTQVLHLSGPEAYLRITAARTAREHPVLLAMLADGRLHLSAIAKLAPHLTAENRDTILSRAKHRSKREIEELIAEIAPRPDVPSLMRRLPNLVRRADADDLARAGTSSSGTSDATIVSLVPTEGSRAVARELRPDGVADRVEWRESRGDGQALPPSSDPRSPRRAVIEPIAPSRYKVQFTASAALREKLERLQALLRSEVPNADLAVVIDRAVSEALKRLEARRYGKRATQSHRTTPKHSATPGRPTPPPPEPSGIQRHSRYIPAAVRHAVHERDGGRCHYKDAAGRRCPERHGLEYHHVNPFGKGGGGTPENLRLMCRTHNLYLAEHDYGRQAMAKYRRPSQGRTKA